MSKKATKAVVKYKPLFADSDSAFKTERSLDTMIFSGSYLVEITHNGADVGLPIRDCGDVHYIVGTLVVTDSGTGGRKQKNRVIGQVLTITSRENKETKVYSRTFADGSWGAWRSLVNSGMYDNIASTDELLSTVTELVAENVRSKKFEDIVKRNATDISSLESSATAASVIIMGSSIDKGVVHTTKIPAATAEKAGVMSAEDKKALDGNVNSSSYSVVDAFGNIILKIDKEGLRTTEVTTSHGKLGELLDTLTAAVEVSKRELGADVYALKETTAQTSRDVAGKMNREADSDSFAIADSVGNIIFKVDKEGAHAPNLNVVTPTWVIAQVLGEVYIPSNIVRDSAGDVVSCDVLFSNGIAGKIVLARENGDVSHIAATHGGVNVEVEIIREDGNVKQINIM